MLLDSTRPSPRQPRARERVDAICAAALRVLRSSGLSGCTVAAVAAEADVTAASLYRYFPNIEAVLHAVACQQLDVTHERLDLALTGLQSPEQARGVLLAVLDDYEQRFRDDPALRAVWAGAVVLDSLVALNLADSRRNAALITERLTPLLDHPVDPDRTFLITHLVCSAVTMLLQVDQDEADRLRRSLRALVLTLVD
jgi:AcrR family transcriptional regulator